MIYTLDYIAKEAEAIAGHWNGSDERFIDANGDLRNDDEAQAASEILDTINNLKANLEYLHI